MSVGVFLAVLFAAFLHAAWNAAVRSEADRAVGMAAVVLGQAISGLACMAFLPAPDAASWPWIVLGAALHLGYQLFLVAAYRIGDLSAVYPLARGLAPLLVAGASTAFLGADLGTAGWAGVVLISCGLASLVIVRADGRHVRPSRSTAMALGAGVFIAAYTLADGVGARISGAPVAFFGWLTVLNAAAFFAILPLWRPGALGAVPAAWRTVLGGGGASFAAYAIAVWAFTQAPIALVAALRETSILFALAIGVLVLKERLDLRRVAAACLTLLGAIALRAGRAP